MKVAADGTVYVCYSDDTNVFIKFSTDKGNTWSDAIRVSDGLETKTAVFPWMTTGPVPGTIGVVWYGSDKNSTGDDTADWHVFYALGTDVKGNPTFRQAEASDHVIHGANISEAGLVVGGQSPNRNLADYFQVAFDPTGAAVIGYCDDHNDLSGHAFVTRQISGPGATGAAVPVPVEGSALPAPPNEPVPTAAKVGGIPGSQVTDFPHDVRLGGNPELGGTAVVPVDDPLDILSILYSAEPTSPSDSAPLLVATMKVSDMTALPPSSNWRMTFTANAPNSVLSPTGEYTFGVSDRGDGFFFRATTDSSGAQTFVYGTAKRNFDGSITYADKGNLAPLGEDVPREARSAVDARTFYSDGKLGRGWRWVVREGEGELKDVGALPWRSQSLEVVPDRRYAADDVRTLKWTGNGRASFGLRGLRCGG